MTTAIELRLGDLDIDLRHGSVSREGRTVALTPMEWRILAMLMRRPGSVLSRAELASAIAEADDDPSDNAIGVHLYNLRRKLGRHAIETIRGRGFRISV